MNQETKNCQNCKKDFTIEPEDFNFYEKIKVPPPTFCPECRMIRRLIWRNVRSLYKRTCGLCGKSLISMYSDKDTAPVYCHDCWYGDKWNPLSYGKEYDFSKPFFTQLKELFNTTPRFFAYHLGNLVRSDFTNYSVDNKDCYLTFAALGNEDVKYSESIDKSKNSLDCYLVQKVENCSYNIDCEANYNTHYAIKSRNCIDSCFIYNCVNCSNCCLSYNQRNQQYVFKNKKLTKEEYQKSLSGLNLEKYSEFKKTQDYFDLILEKEIIYRYAQIYNSANATGDTIGNSKNILDSFEVQNSENIAYSVRVIENTKDSYDLTGAASGELIYESVAASFVTFKDYFCHITLGSKECQYSSILKNCSNCFGCAGLTNAQYCIFNKQYSKEEYFEMVEKIKEHMNKMPYVDQKGRIFKYGEFFPYDMSPSGYNETNAHDFFPIKEKEALEKGYPWKKKEKKDYKITINSSELSDSILDASETIIDEVIGCPNSGDQDFQCSSAYRITQDDLNFYKQKNLPLPRYCPNCRHYQRLKYRNPLKLWHRTCMCDKTNHTHKGKCSVEFETSYAPDRPDIIYCEKCYQQEVY